MESVVKDDFIENLVIKGISLDKQLLVSVQSAFRREYFETSVAGDIFMFLKDHIEKYDTLPSRDIITNSVAESEEYFKEIDSIDVDLVKDYDYVFDQVNNYLKDRALKTAILESVDIINKGDSANNGLIQKLIEDAIIKDLKMDLGLNYFETNKERLRRILSSTTKRVPTYFPTLDEYLSGGFPPYTLSVFLARTHGGKSNMMINMASRQVLHGHNVVMITLEMSEDAVAQRIDAIYSGLDINRLYVVKDSTKALIKKLAELKDTPGLGKLFIKEFPTGDASVIDIKRYLRELKMRGVNVDIVFVDYINLMRSSNKNVDDLYGKVKKVAEELRAMSLAFDIPFVSVSQLNREGSNIVNLKEIDFTHISESIALAATADFMAIFGSDDEAMVYRSEIGYKIVKNRLGGRVGEINKFYFDTRTLKLYDSVELDIWLSDAETSMDERALAVPRERQPGRIPGRRN